MPANRRNKTVIDATEFHRRLRDRLLDMTAEHQGVLRIEAVRRYHTDARFHAQMDLICATALQVLQELQSGIQEAGVPEEYTEAFRMETQKLLGWGPDD